MVLQNGLRKDNRETECPNSCPLFLPGQGEPNGRLSLNHHLGLCKLVHLYCKFCPLSCVTVHSHMRCPELTSMGASFKLTVFKEGKSLKLEGPNNVTNANYSPSRAGMWFYETPLHLRGSSRIYDWHL